MIAVKVAAAAGRYDRCVSVVVTTLTSLVMTEIAPIPARFPTADAMPAGFVTIMGPFARAHREAILALVRREARQESDAHPSHCILAIKTSRDAVDVETSDLALPRRIGEALERVYHGSLQFVASKDRTTLRVRWAR